MAYVELAKQRCDQARTMEEKMKSVGCVIKDKSNHCKRLSALRGRRSALD
jgi:hypothetical protein